MIASTQLIEDACRCAGLFRLGRNVEAALDMIELIDRLMPLFAAGPNADQQQWLQLLQTLLNRQEAMDWLGLADYLEYELLDLLGS